MPYKRYSVNARRNRFITMSILMLGLLANIMFSSLASAVAMLVAYGLLGLFWLVRMALDGRFRCPECGEPVKDALLAKAYSQPMYCPWGGKKLEGSGERAGVQ